MRQEGDHPVCSCSLLCSGSVIENNKGLLRYLSGDSATLRSKSLYVAFVSISTVQTKKR